MPGFGTPWSLLPQSLQQSHLQAPHFLVCPSNSLSHRGRGVSENVKQSCLHTAAAFPVHLGKDQDLLGPAAPAPFTSIASLPPLPHSVLAATLPSSLFPEPSSLCPTSQLMSPLVPQLSIH